MGDLQLGLLVIGALAVVGVLGYNWRQERNARREAQRAFGTEHTDVLIDGRREPTLEPRRAEPPPGATPDERVDYIIDVRLPTGAETEAREAWRAIELRFGRRAMLTLAGDRARAALQLVSRSGVVPDAELVEFRSLVETTAEKLGGTVRAPEMRPALEAARELDRACADADVQVALHVVGVTPGEVEGAEHFQVTPRDDGVTLTLDVARTPEPSRTYEAMARAGRQLAQRGGGRLVDDTGRELDERALASVGAQLEAVRQLLLSRGIEPGSPLALRLFS
jgi:hypothetical protein